MFQKVVPGVVAFILLFSLVIATIAGFRLYQVSNLAVQLLTGQATQIAAPQIAKQIKEAVQLALDAEALKNHTLIPEEPEEAAEEE